MMVCVCYHCDMFRCDLFYLVCRIAFGVLWWWCPHLARSRFKHIHFSMFHSFFQSVLFSLVFLVCFCFCFVLFNCVWVCSFRLSISLPFHCYLLWVYFGCLQFTLCEHFIVSFIWHRYFSFHVRIRNNNTKRERER